MRKNRFCVKEKRYIAIIQDDLAKLKVDLHFLDNALKTVLAKYRNYFQKRFVEGLSIRRYAAATSSIEAAWGLPAKEILHRPCLYIS